MSNRTLLGLLIIGLTCLVSCKNSQLLTREKPPFKSKNFLKNQLDNQQINFERISWKADVSLNQNGDKSSFKVNARIITDTSIWLSITPALGIEVARVLLSQDSVKFINKIDKTYFEGDYQFINNKFGIELDFYTIQNALFGTPILFNINDKYQSVIEDEAYMIQAKSTKKLSRITGVKKQDWTPVDSLDITQKKEKKLQKVLDKLPEEASILTRYWLSENNYYLIKQGLYDFDNSQQLEIIFNNHIKVDDKPLPSEINIIASGAGNYLKANISLSKFKTKKYSLPFSISDKYEALD